MDKGIKMPSLKNIFVKTIIFFILFNIIFILLGNASYGRITLYNLLFPGRDRLPFGETSLESFNLTMFNVDAMVASHKFAAEKKAENEYRIAIIGDSSIWGFLQESEDTLAGLLDKNIDFLCDGKIVKVFNLGYPSLSVLKDLVVLEKGKAYKPDLVLWFVTLESLISKDQMQTPIVKNNPILVNSIIKEYKLSFPVNDIKLKNALLIEQKRNLADLIRHQLYGVLWAGSGIDQVYPREINPAQRDFKIDSSYKDFDVNQFNKKDLATEVIINAVKRLSMIDFIVINEPILISTGKNTDIRYNFYYPKWAYDKYRSLLASTLKESNILYYDFWNLVPESEFTNSAIHLNLTGELFLANETKKLIKTQCETLGRK